MKIWIKNKSDEDSITLILTGLPYYVCNVNSKIANFQLSILN